MGWNRVHIAWMTWREMKSKRPKTCMVLLFVLSMPSPIGLGSLSLPLLVHSKNSMRPTFQIPQPRRPPRRPATLHQILPLPIQIHQTFLRRTKLPQFDAGFLENLRRLGVHVVTLTVHHFRDTDLDDFDGTCQTRTCIAIQHSSIAHSFASGFEEGIFLGVDAEAGTQVRASGKTGRTGSIASRTAAFGAVLDVSWRAVVARGEDPFVSYQDATHLPPHAIRSSSREGCEGHEVVVPCWADSARVGEGEGVEGGPEFW